MHRRLFFLPLAAVLCVLSSLAPPMRRPPVSRPCSTARTSTGWKVHAGKMEVWSADKGMIVVDGRGGGWLMTEKEYGDFELRLEYRLPKRGNSGVALRAPLQGDPAYQGMEIQVLDDENYKGIKPTQYTGSIYDVVPPSKHVSKPAGEWNTMRIVAKGRQITIELNGTKIVDANLDEYKDRVKADPEKKLAAHPGLLRTTGHLGLQSHDGRVEFRNLFVKPL